MGVTDAKDADVTPPKGGYPHHVAIIMDGNGRWATERSFARTWGHREGTKRVDEIVTEACNIGIRYLTLYAFSTENWNRPTFEVSMLMRLLVQHLKKMDKKLLKNRVKLVTQGQIERLPKFVQRELKRVVKLTDFPDPALTLNLALSYGGRQEIIESARAIAVRVAKGKITPEQIDEAEFKSHLYQPEFPDPDVLIRTGGELRVSNFLLWQIAYTEIIVVPALWPDFTAEVFRGSLAQFKTRERRFGKTSAQVAGNKDPRPLRRDTRMMRHETL